MLIQKILIKSFTIYKIIDKVNINNGAQGAIELYTPIVDNMGHVVGNNIEEITLPYGYKTFTTKGLSEKVVINKHAFRNTLIPLVTSLAGLLPSLFSGAIITEQVFNLPGIGNIALDAMNRGDIPFIMGYNMFLALLSVVGVLLADLMYGIVDPRVKLE